MSKLIGKKISHYRILEQIGQGGMGVVYKAEDTKLKRTVALKFLPESATGSGEQKKRFLREAQAAAALNHSNIAHIYEIDEADGQTFLAMEYIEGKSIREMLVGNGHVQPLPLDDAIDYAIQITKGLQAAHEKGIIHRDIKSTNIMVTDKGQVKIMDFGLAKLADRSMITREGTTLGTVAYMSPEQAQSLNVDHRTDIWSLGVVLYEMVTGQLPFNGDYEQAIVYSILNEDPEPLTAIRSGVPMKLEEIVNKLLAKEPADRYQNVVELPVDLKAVDFTSIERSKISTTKFTKQIVKQSPAWQRWLPWGIAALMTFITAMWWLELQRPTPSPVKRSHINLPQSAPIAPIGSAPLAVGRPALALSPDGRNLVYVADIGGETQLYLRPMDKFEAVPIPGTEGAYNPFFSPDGQWVGFFAGNELKKVAVSGGTPVSLCDATNSCGADWGHDDRIIFSNFEGAQLLWVSESGGTPHILADKSPGYCWPDILPGGKAVLVSDARFESYRLIFVGTDEEKNLSIAGSNFKYVPTGHLVYSKGGRLEAVAFDLENLEVTSSPVPVLDSVRTEAALNAPQYTISRDGTLIYLPGGLMNMNTLVWLDREGKVEQLPFPAENYGQFQLSPDGRRLAIDITRNEKLDVWIYDLFRGQRTKLTLPGNNWLPIWSPDGKWIAFSSDRSGRPFNLFMKSVDGTDKIRRLAESEIVQGPFSWSPDNKILGFSEFGSGGFNIFLLEVESENKPQPFTSSRHNEWASAFSPNGKWIAYTSDEQGQGNIYVQPYPQTGERWQISTEGGETTVWSPNSNELFFRNGRKWMVVEYATIPKFSFTVPKVLFKGDYANIAGREFDISPDGKRFLLLKPSEEFSERTKLNVVTNWFEELKRKVPKGK